MFRSQSPLSEWAREPIWIVASLQLDDFRDNLDLNGRALKKPFDAKATLAVGLSQRHYDNLVTKAVVMVATWSLKYTPRALMSQS